MKKLAKNLNCWVLSEGIAGTENQCLAVVEALGISPTVKRVALKEPWKSFSPPLLVSFSSSFTPALDGPWPDLLIAAGRKSVAASIFIKRKSGGRTFTVQLQNPRVSTRHFDIVAVPYHDMAGMDTLDGGNIIVMDGAPNRVTPERLREAAGKFSPTLPQSAEISVALLIGGRSKAYKMTEGVANKIINDISLLRERTDINLFITFSRRTEGSIRRLFQSRLQGQGIFLWDGEGENPYFGFLALADYIIVTQESVSMLSDALSTGKPVYMVAMAGESRRFQRFHELIRRKYQVRMFDGHLQPCCYERPRDAELVAEAVKQRLFLPAGESHKV